MATLFTPSTEFVDVVDGLEAVTVKFPGVASGTSVAHAKRRSITTREVSASFGRYTSGDVNWHLPVSELASQPKLGSKIVDSGGVYWTVINVENCTRGTRWKCASRALEIVAGLDTTIRIQRARFTKDNSGAAVSEFFDSDVVKAKIQETGANNTVEASLSLTRRTFDIILAEEVNVDSTCQVIGPDGTAYQVDSYERAETIDSLPVIRASTDPWPNV